MLFRSRRRRMYPAVSGRRLKRSVGFCGHSRTSVALGVGSLRRITLKSGEGWISEPRDAAVDLVRWTTRRFAALERSVALSILTALPRRVARSCRHPQEIGSLRLGTVGRFNHATVREWATCDPRRAFGDRLSPHGPCKGLPLPAILGRRLSTPLRSAGSGKCDRCSILRRFQANDLVCA